MLRILDILGIVAAVLSIINFFRLNTIELKVKAKEKPNLTKLEVY